MSEASHINSSMTAESSSMYTYLYIILWVLTSQVFFFFLSASATILSVMLLGIHPGSYIFFIFLKNIWYSAL